MTAIQQHAIQLIQQLPDDKVRAIITLAADEINLMELKKQEQTKKKKDAFDSLEKLDLGLPKNFDADKELASALKAFRTLREEAQMNNPEGMTLEEINEEINKARSEIA